MNKLKTVNNMENEKKHQQPASQPQEHHTDSVLRSTGDTGDTGDTGTQRLSYEAPAVEVIEVQTERGYAASGSSNDPWGPGTW